MRFRIWGHKSIWLLRRSICCGLLFAFAPALALAQQAKNYCEPSPAVKAALKKVSEIDNGKLSAKLVREQTLEQLRALLKQYPDDLFVHLQYQLARYRSQNVYSDPQHRDPELLIAEYRARLEKHPDDPVSLYLYSKLLIGRHTKEALGIMEKVLKQAPNFAQAYQSLFYIYQSPTYLDKAKAQENLKQSLATCPNTRSSYDPLSFGQQLDDPEILQSGAQKLRALLEKSTDPDDLWYYGNLWRLESRLKPASEQAQVREQVAADLQRLRAMNTAQTENLLSVLRDGYKQIGNKESEQWVIEEMLRRFPNSRTAARFMRERWRAEHPIQTKDGAEKVQAYYEARFSASEQWVQQWPKDLASWYDRFDSISHLPKITDAEFDKVTDGFLRALDQNTATSLGSQPLPILIAEAYLKRNLHLDRIHKLVERGISEEEWSAKRQQQSDLIPKAQKEARNTHVQFVRQASWPLALEADLRLNQPNKAREVLEQMAAALAQEKPSEAAKTNEKMAYAYKQATYWDWMGRLAEHEQRKLDALICYQTALTFPMQEHRDEKTNELTEKTRKLWQALGGTDDGWKAWLALAEATEDAKEVPPEFAWKPKGKPLPDFTVTDLQGRKWQSADLKGKVVFINFWATWCGPCQKELPYVQKLSEQMKNRPDVMVLTFNVDSDLSLVAPFMKENKYTFTVLPAYSYLRTLIASNPIPCNWVVSTDGICQMEQIGFGGESGAKWMRQVLDAIEKARGSK